MPPRRCLWNLFYFWPYSFWWQRDVLKSQSRYIWNFQVERVFFSCKLHENYTNIIFYESHDSVYIYTWTYRKHFKYAITAANYARPKNISQFNAIKSTCLIFKLFYDFKTCNFAKKNSDIKICKNFFGI